MLSDYLARLYAGESPGVPAEYPCGIPYTLEARTPLTSYRCLWRRSGRYASQLVILSFTGMRAIEAENLPYDCLSETRLDGVTHYAIEGITTKLSGGRPRRACWVTSPLAARAPSGSRNGCRARRTMRAARKATPNRRTVRTCCSAGWVSI